MKKKPPKPRSAPAKALSDRLYHQRVVPSGKAYKRNPKHKETKCNGKDTIE